MQFTEYKLFCFVPSTYWQFSSGTHVIEPPMLQGTCYKEIYKQLIQT